MRPSILIIIFDFLVSSLLLFVVADAPAHKKMRVIQSELGNTQPDSGNEFSPAAVQEMESKWKLDADVNWQIQNLRNLQNTNEDLSKRLMISSTDNQRLSQEVELQQKQIKDLDEDARSKADTIRQKEAIISHKEMEKENSELNRIQSEKELAEAKSTLAKLKSDHSSLKQKLTEVSANKDALKEEVNLIQSEYNRSKELISQQQAVIKKLAETNVQISEKLDNIGEQISDTKSALKSDVLGLKNQLESFRQQAEKQNEEMQIQFASISQKISALPDQIKSSVSDLNQTHQNLSNAIQSITSTAMQLAQVKDLLSASEMSDTLKQLKELNNFDKENQNILVSAINSLNTDNNVAPLQRLREEQAQTLEKLATMASQLETLSARQKGPYAAVSQSRMEVSISMVEEDRGPGAWVDPDDYWSGRIYPTLFFSNNTKFIAAYYASVGLDWKEMIGDGDMKEVSIAIGRPPGDNRWSASYLGEWRFSLEEPRIVLLPVTDERAVDKNALKLYGRENVLKNGTKGFRLFKAISQGTSFDVEASPDLTSSPPKYVNIVSPMRHMVEKVIKPSDARPDPGDVIVTQDGLLVGIMVDSSRCYVLDELSIKESVLKIPIAANPIEYRDGARNLINRLE